MKKLLLILTAGWLLLYCSTSLMAQAGDGAPSRLEKSRRFLLRYHSICDTAPDVNAKLGSLRGVEMVADGFNDDWISPYYAAYNNAIISIMVSDTALRSEMMKKAEKYIKKAESIRQEESEIVLLRGMINGIHIRHNPALGDSLGPKVIKDYEMARKLNPENPRAYLVLGESAMYTPEQFGGGDKKAKELLKTALKKYEYDHHEDPAWPFWGMDRAKMLLEQIEKKK
jgi:hypothetical protein